MKKEKRKLATSCLSFLSLMLCLSLLSPGKIYGKPTIDVVTQVYPVKGIVLDATGKPQANVNVTEKGTANGTTTNDAGEFTIAVTDEKAVLVFSKVGYTSFESKVTGGNLTITLGAEIGNMDEVVVVGFGKQKKASVVGAIANVSAKELRVPTSSLSNAFAGRIAGVVAVQRGGEPGADGSNFWVRGIATFAGPSSPLIFIDGIESSASDMNNLASEVIDNFSVLKDASATALYGARGANGVLLITTKRGGNMEKAKVNFRITNAIGSPTQTVKTANAVDYMNAYNYAETNRGRVPRFTQEKIDGTINNVDAIAYPNVDWEEVLFKNSTMNQYINLNVTGGGQRADYFVSASFNNDNGILRKDPYNDFDNNIKMRRMNLLANVGVELSKTTKAIIRVISRVEKYNGSAISSATLYSRMFLANPALFQPVLPNTIGADHIIFGNVNGGPIPIAGGSNIYYNPYASMVSGFEERDISTNTGSLEINQKMDWLLKGFSLRGLVSYNNNNRTNIARSFTPFYYEVSNAQQNNGVWQYQYRNLSQGTNALTASSTNTGNNLLNLNLVADWLRSFGNHDISVMATTLMRDYNVNNPTREAELNANVSLFQQSLARRNIGYAGRVTYAYKNKYLFEGNFGYNGSEVFEKGQRFGFFPSLAAGYMISREKFWEPVKSVIQNLKFRASWGLVGNAAIYSSDGSEVRFPYMDDVNLTSGAVGYTFGEAWQTSRANGPAVLKYGAQGARWEEGEKINIGMDITLLKNLNITADWFTETRSGIFMPRGLISAETGITGTNLPYANIGVVKNSGFDASLSYNHQVNRDLYINLRGTFTYTNNKYLERDEAPNTPAIESQLGRNIGIRKVLIAEGLFKDEADIANSPKSTYNSDLKPGDIKYKDLNGDGVIDNYDMTYSVGNPVTPKMVYGFGVNAQYKKFDLGIFFQGVAKVTLFLDNVHPFSPE